MANLLSWLGGVANDIGGQVNNAAGAVNNFAVRPIQQAQNQAIRNVQRVAQPVANNFAEQAKRTALFKMQQDMARASANVQAGLRQGAGQVNNNIGFGIKVAQATPRAFQNINQPLPGLGVSAPQIAMQLPNATRETWNMTRPAREMFAGGTGQVLNTVKSLPAGVNVFSNEQGRLVAKALGMKDLENKAALQRQQAFEEFSRLSQEGINPVGSAQQKAIDQGGVEGLKAFSTAMATKGGKAGLEIAPVVTGAAATVPLKTVLLKGGTLSTAANLGYSGITGQYGGDRSIQEKALQAGVDVVGGYGGEALGYGIGKLAPHLINATRNPAKQAVVDFNAPQVAKNLADKGRLQAEGFTNIRVGKIAGAPSTPSPTTAQNFVHNVDGRFGNKNKAAQTEIDLLKQHQREQLIISQRSPNPIEKQGALQNYKVAQDRIDVLENPKVPQFNQDAPKAKQYLYHGTADINLDSITKEGLRPGRRGMLSLSKDEAYSKTFAKTPDFYKVQKDGVMFRVDADYLKGKTRPGKGPVSDQLNELLTKETIPPKYLEIQKNGQWQPLASNKPINELAPKSKVDPLLAEARKYKSADEFVKAQGTPVYHGTVGKFDTFDPNKLGSNTGANSAKEGFFFTPQKEVARTYVATGAVKTNTSLNSQKAINEEIKKVTGGDIQSKAAFKMLQEDMFSRPSGYTPKQKIQVNKLLEKYNKAASTVEKYSDENFLPTDSLRKAKGANIVEAYVKMDNPLVVDAKGAKRTPKDYVDLSRKAKEAGNDGVIIKNTFDRTHEFGKDTPHEVRIAFNSDQIKTKSRLTDIYNQAHSGRAIAETAPEPKLPKGWKVNKEGEVLTPQGKVATPHDIENMEAGRVLSKKDITQFDQKQADMNTHGRTGAPIYETAPKPNNSLKGLSDDELRTKFYEGQQKGVQLAGSGKKAEAAKLMPEQDRILAEMKSRLPGEVTPQNKRVIDSYTTPKPVNEYKAGERVSSETMGGSVEGTITKTPDFSKDLRLKGNDFEVKLSNGTTIKTDGGGFSTPISKPVLEVAPKPNKIPEVPAKKGIVTEAPTLRKGLTGNKKVGDKLEIQLGKQYEANGGKVDYTGLNKGMQDHGIDLVSVNKDNSITLIQAKVRGQNTSLHERPVQAFFAASEQAKKQYPGRNINAVLHTTSKVDDDAIKFANSHGITIVQQNLDGTGQRVVTNSKRAVSDGVLDISDIDKQRIQNSIPVENRAAFLADINNPDSELSKVLSSVEPNKRFSMAEDWYKATNPQGTYELTSLKGLASKISQLDSPDAIKKMVRDDIAQNAKLNGSNPLEDALIKKLDDADFANRLAGETNPSKIRKLLNEVAGGDVYDPILKPTITKQALLKDVTPSTKITKVAGENKIEEAKTLLLNRFEPVEQFVRNKQKEIGRTLKPSENPTYYIKEFLGGGGIANAKIDGELTPIIRQTKQFDSLRQYMIAQRTNELADRGLSSKRADDVLSQIRSKVGDDEFKNFDKVANELYAFQKKELHQLVDVGVLTQQRFDDIVAKNQKYIPFNRVLPDGVSQLSQGGSKISSPKNPIKAIKGSDLEIIDPVESMIKNVYDIQATVQKQKVLNSLYKLAPDEFQPLKGGTLKTPAIEMFQNGKRVKLAADQDLSRALNSMDEENLNFAVRALSLPARTLRSGATGLNIGFVIPNVIRDQLSAAVNSKYGGIPIYDFMSGLASVIKKDDSYKKWILSGADQASFFAQDRKTLQRGVSDVTGNKLAQAGKYVKNPLEVFRIMGEYSEKGSRVGVFKRAVRGAKREGLTGEDVTLAAMRESREATIDFAQRGAKMKAINAMTPFLNARLQGSYKMIQSFKQRPVQTAAIGMAFAGAPAAALYIWNTQGENKKTYDEIPDYLKRENFILVTGNDSVPFIKVPKGEIGKIFGNTTESFLAAIKQEDSNWADTATTIADSFLPVGSVKEPARFVTDTMPTAASVPMQLLANYDAFRDKNIVGQYQKTLPAAAQSSKYNTETSKMIGEALNISPAKLEFAVSGFTGGLGRQGLQLVDAAMGNKIPVQELPVASRFMGEQKDLRNSADNLYESLEKQSAETALQNYKIKEALKKGDYSKLTGDTERDNRLKRSVAEEKLKETLNPKEKAMFGMTNEQLEDMGTDEANKILALKKSLSTSKSTAKNPKEKYEYALASYNEKKSKGEISDVNEMSEQKSLSKLKAQSDFSQDINDLYSKPNKEIDTYLRSKPNGGNIYNNLLALDDALVAQGFSSKFKDKYGNKKRLATASGTKAKKGRKASKKKVAQLPNLVKSGMFKSSKIVAKGTPTSKLSVKSLPKVSVGKNYA